MNAGNVGRDAMAQEIHAFKGTTRAAILAGLGAWAFGRRSVPAFLSTEHGRISISAALGGVEFSFPG